MLRFKTDFVKRMTKNLRCSNQQVTAILFVLQAFRTVILPFGVSCLDCQLLISVRIFSKIGFKFITGISLKSMLKVIPSTFKICFAPIKFFRNLQFIFGIFFLSIQISFVFSLFIFSPEKLPNFSSVFKAAFSDQCCVICKLRTLIGI